MIGTPAFLLQQGPVIILSPERSIAWGPNAAHPTRGGVSVFRTLSNEPDRFVTLALYSTSHHLSSTEFVHGEGAPRELKLRSNEILVVQGALRMEISLPAGGSLVWQGFSESPWGLDPSSAEAFPFMRI